MGNNILVIDDEQLVLKTIGRFLERRGHNVALAQSEAEALDKVENENFDLLISVTEGACRSVNLMLRGSGRVTSGG